MESNSSFGVGLIREMTDVPFLPWNRANNTDPGSRKP